MNRLTVSWQICKCHTSGVLYTEISFQLQHACNDGLRRSHVFCILPEVYCNVISNKHLILKVIFPIALQLKLKSMIYFKETFTISSNIDQYLLKYSFTMEHTIYNINQTDIYHGPWSNRHLSWTILYTILIKQTFTVDYHIHNIDQIDIYHELWYLQY